MAAATAAAETAAADHRPPVARAAAVAVESIREVATRETVAPGVAPVASVAPAKRAALLEERVV